MFTQRAWSRWCRKIGLFRAHRVPRVRRADGPWSAEVLEQRTLLTTITVTSLADNTTVDGQVTLREAIQAANTNTSIDGSAAGQSGSGFGAVQDVIVFQAGLTGTITLNPALGQLQITDSVKIVGLGSANTIVSAQQNSRVFLITNTAGNVELDAMTITGGKIVGNNADGLGGGISFLSSGRLTLDGSIITGNAVSGPVADGGGIYAANGSVALIRSTVTNNSAAGPYAFGAGIYTQGGNVSLTKSTVSGNLAEGNYAQGAGIASVTGVITLTDSTVSGNQAVGQMLAFGGGIYSQNGAVTLTQSTMSANSAQASSQISTAAGGAIYNSLGNIVLNASTISGNSVHDMAGLGGGAYAFSGSMVVTNSIVAGNTAAEGGSPSDLYFRNYKRTATFSASYSLIGTNSGTPLAPAPVDGPNINGNIVGTSGNPIDPMLAPLADNGGPTLTMALLPGSPALNRGGTSTLRYDQRGTPFDRVVAGLLDMGAFENQLTDTTPVTTVNVTAGVAFPTITLMTFFDTDPAAQPSDFTVTVNWGTTLVNGSFTLLRIPTASVGSLWTVVGSGMFPADASQDIPYMVTVSVHDTHGNFATTASTTINVLQSSPPARQLARQTGLAGFYYANSQLAEVLQNGDALMLVDGAGNTSAGTISNNTNITAPAFGLTGVFDQSAGTITFSDSSVWTKVRQIEGNWITGNGLIAGIRQLGTDLTFTGGTGSVSVGSFVDATTLVAAGWGNIQGTLSSDGLQINWSNGTVWNLISDFQGDWQSNSGAPTFIEQQGATLVFVNRMGETSTGRVLNATQVVTGANWGNVVGTILGNTIQFSNGSTWSIPTATQTYPDLGSLWQNGAGHETRALQAGLALTFINASGDTSVGEFISNTWVHAIDWHQYGQIVGNVIQWGNGTSWIRVPSLAGAYLDQNNHETGINQLERHLTFTDQAGVVTHGTLLDATHIVESDGSHRTATINDNVITWSTGAVWTGLPQLSGNWGIAGSNVQPTYVEQAGASLLFVTQAGARLAGRFVTPTTAQLTEQGVPSPPTINVSIPNSQVINFGGGLEWDKNPPNFLDDIFADPDFWPFV